ncbi:MAG: MFS transporter, partial [Acidobacteria bacterium]|nr:MFS transporter [Acidobacteriota bacterium]
MAINNAFDEANKNKSLAETGVEESAGTSVTGVIAESLTENPVRSGGNFRWVICALLFFATTINYVDRQVLGILAKPLQQELGWSEADYGFIATAFTGAYAIGLLVVGRLMDWLGTRKGFSFAIIFWSLAAMAHAFARSAFGFGAARFALGLGEAGNFPAAIKTTAEWFPKKERALATGIFNSGSNVGAIIAPLAVPLITAAYGWREAFIFTGALGFIWLAFWLWLYRKPEEHPRLSKSELAYIQSDAVEPTVKIPWLRLLPHRQTWAYAAGKFFTDPVWWFFLFWLPKFLNENYGLSLSQIGPPLIVIYVSADVGSIGGGYLSSALIKRGWTVNAGRKTAMLVCALCVVPIYFAVHAANLWTAVALISLATAAHQGFSANLYTLVSDMFPRRVVGSVVGIGGFAGSISGMLVASAVGLLLQATGSYTPIFAAAAIAYLFALLVIHLLAPKLEPAKLDVAE